MKLLSGAELAGYIKERQAKQVRRLKQTDKIQPKLMIIKSISAGPVIDTYVRMKQAYANDLGIEVEVVSCEDDDMKAHIERGNSDDSVQAIVVQLPIADPSKTQDIVDTIAPEKDVDGLGTRADYISATAEAIDWLLSGYGVELKDKKIAILGRGKLVGAPLAGMWSKRGLDVTVIDKDTPNPAATLVTSDVIVSATGSAHLLKSKDVKQGAIVVDAGTVSEDGKILGDASPELYERDDLKITPQKGGVGPLTIVMMFDHVIRACFTLVEKRNQL